MKEGVNYAAANGTDSFQLCDMEQDGDSEDSKDSDDVQLFELPKRKLVRPMSSALRRKIRPANKCWKTTKECCRVFVTVTLPMLIAVFIVSTILCLTFLLVGVAGMKQEISMLKLRLKNVDAAERSFMGKKEQLRREFQSKLSNIISYQSELMKLKNSVKQLSAQLNKLNVTVHQFHAKPTTQLSSKLAVLQHDIDTLKTGMADTGADIEKLKATGNQLQKDVGGLDTDMRKTKLEMYNMTVQISLIEHKPPPPMTTTPKTLVVTVVPDQDTPPSRKELKVMLANSEQKQMEACKKEVLLYGIKLDRLRNNTLVMNKTYSEELSYLRHHILTEASKASKVNTSHADNLTTHKPITLSKAALQSPVYTLAANHTTIKPISSPAQAVTKPAVSNKSESTADVAANATSVTQEVTTKKMNTTVASYISTSRVTSEQNSHKEKRDELNGIQEDERLETFEHKESSNLNDKGDQPLLQEYIKREENHDASDEELDNLDDGNSKF